MYMHMWRHQGHGCRRTLGVKHMAHVCRDHMCEVWSDLVLIGLGILVEILNHILFVRYSFRRSLLPYNVSGICLLLNHYLKVLIASIL